MDDVSRSAHPRTFFFSHGAVILGIDVAEGMPPLWRFGEGPAFAATGAIVLWLQFQRGARERIHPNTTTSVDTRM